MTDPLHDWAREYSEGLGEMSPDHLPAAQRARLLFAYRKTRTKRFSREAFGALCAGVLVMAGAVLWYSSLSTKQEESSPSVAVPLLDAEQLSAGQPIITQGSAKTLRFESGTRATFERSSSGRLSKLSQDTVELTLDEGALEMEVEREPGRTWIVKSGKFRVYVIGTAFSLRRESVTEKFQVRVKRGKVRIEGAEIQGKELLLGAGEEFSWQPSATQPSAAPESAAPIAPIAPELVKEAGRDAAERPPQGKQAASGDSATWQSLAQAGKYELALEQVENQGVERVLGEASADERLLLGNAARYSGRIELGRRSYLAARESGGAAAPLAAYYLAKIALDTNGDQSGAIGWLQTYLLEAPSGDLAVSARARLMNLLQATGRHAEAEKVAREYLSLHPSGPNAMTARQLLERH